MEELKTSVSRTKEDRIEWIDMIKAICIILVVMGHATGKFNGYIYQFHMAAFFMISGYTEYYSKRTTPEYIAVKWLRLMQPFVVVFLVGLLISCVFNKFGVYNFLFPDDQIYIGVKESLKALILHGNNYVWWMGACWFICALFFALVIQKVIHSISEDLVVIFLISGLLVLFQRGFPREALKFGLVDGKIALVAQFYLCLGEIARRTDCVRVINGNGVQRAVFFNSCFLAVMIFAKQVVHYTVNWPSTDFEFSLIGCLIGVCDTLLVSGIAYTVSSLKSGKFKSVLVMLGKNTLSVVFFHFVFFTVIHVILAAVGILNWSDVKTFLLPASVSKLWWLYTVGSIGMSILFWKGLMKIKIIKMLLGQDALVNFKLTYGLRRKNEYVSSRTTKDQYWKKAVQNRWKILNLFVYVIYGFICLLPLLQMGITCRDDFLWRMYASVNPYTVVGEYVKAAINQGRVLSAIQGISLAIVGFPNRITFGVMKGVLFLSNIVLMSTILDRLLIKKGKYLFLAAAPLLLQITLKPVPPDAFSSFIALPFSCILFSVLLFDLWLEKKKRKWLTASLILYFVSLCAYESMLVFSILFFVVAAIRKRNVVGIVKALLPHIATAVLYLVCYSIGRILFPSGYSGNQIEIESFGQVLEFIGRMLIGAIPGVFAQSMYNQMMMRYIRGNPAEFSLFNEIDFRVAMAVILSVGLFVVWLRCFRSEKSIKKRKERGFILMCFLICTVGLTVLNAISGNAKGYLSNPGWIGLPSTYMISMMLIASLCIVFDLLLSVNSKRFRMLCMCATGIGLALWGGMIQCSNHALGDLQTESSNRIERTERVLDLGLINSEENEIYATGMDDIYIMQWVYINDWNTYLKLQQKKAALTDQYKDGNGFLRMMDNGRKWVFASETHGLTDEQAVANQVQLISEHEIYWNKIYYMNTDGMLRQREVMSGFDVRNGYYVYTVDFNEDVRIESIEII